MIVTTRVATMKLLLHALSLLLVLLAVEANKSKSGTCESISSKTCSSSDLFHKLTSTPITVKNGPEGGVTTFKSQKKSLHGTRPYVSLLRKGKDCKRFLKPFVCAVYLPACDDTQMMRPIPPCKELCYQAMERCNEGFTNLNMEWPQQLDCSLFPTSLEDPQCVSAYRLLHKDVTVLDSQALVRVTCSYDAKPQMQPRWVKDGIPVEEISERMRTEKVDGHTTTLVIEGFTDSADRGVYTCAVENDNHGISVNLDDVFQSGDGGSPPEGPDCEELTVPCPTGNKCVSVFAVCNGIQDCPSGADEANCTDAGPFPPQTCEPGQVPCPSGDKCVPISAMCNGVNDCPSGVDETDCTDVGTMPTDGCPPNRIPCPMSDDICIPPMALCDGIKDCPSGMDEMMNCTDIETFPSLCPSNMLPCPSGDKCVPLSAICDGTPDCMSGVDEIDCPSVSVETCVPITVPECTVGLDYTTTIPNYPRGLPNSDKQSIFSSLSTIFDSACGRFFRPFMCSAFLPPCGDKVVPPCRELCFLAVQKCVETFEGILSEEDLMASGAPGSSCDTMPSEADGQCYNVKVVSIGEVIGLGSEDGVEMSVECTYNLMPEVQPNWADPSGNLIRTGSKRRARIIEVSGTVTRLQIDNFTSKRFGGIYTCSADGFSATVEL